MEATIVGYIRVMASQDLGFMGVHRIYGVYRAL